MIFNFYKKVQENSISYSNIEPEDVIFSQDGSRLFAYKDIDLILNECKGFINTIYESFETIDKNTFMQTVYPIIYLFAKHMSVLPASEGCHDAGSMGLLKHSLAVGIKALEVYKKDEITFMRRLCYDNLAIDQMAVFILAMLHDVTKIVCDYDVYVGTRRYDFYANVFDSFVQDVIKKDSDCIKRYGSTFYLKVVFKKSRSDMHDNLHIKTLISTLMLARLDGLLTALSLDHDLAELLRFDDSNLFYRCVKIADKYIVSHQSSEFGHDLNTFARLGFESYMKYVVTSSIKTSSFKVNTNDSFVFVTQKGILFTTYCPEFLSLLMAVHEYYSGTDYKDGKKPLTTPGLALRKVGLLRSYGVGRVNMWHKISLYNEDIFVKGMLFVLDTSSMYTVPCEVLGKDNEIADILKDIKKSRGREPEFVRVKNRRALPHYLTLEHIQHLEFKFLSESETYLKYDKDVHKAKSNRYESKKKECNALLAQARLQAKLEIKRELEEELKKEQEQSENNEDLSFDELMANSIDDKNIDSDIVNDNASDDCPPWDDEIKDKDTKSTDTKKTKAKKTVSKRTKTKQVDDVIEDTDTKNDDAQDDEGDSDKVKIKKRVTRTSKKIDKNKDSSDKKEIDNTDDANKTLNAQEQDIALDDTTVKKRTRKRVSKAQKDEMVLNALNLGDNDIDFSKLQSLSRDIEENL